MVHISERDLQLPDLEFPSISKRVINDKSVISLGPGEPDFMTPAPLLAYAKKVIGESTHYSEPQGLLELREAISRNVLKKNKIKTSPENILISCGSQEALFSSLLTTIDPTEEVVVPSPGYIGYLPAIELVNGVPKLLKLSFEDNFSLNPDLLKKMITKKTQVIILNSPSNPTGNVLPKKILEEVADIAIDKDLWVFSDEAYEDIIYDGAKHISIASLNGMNEHAVTFKTFSKSYAMCGFRLGYCIGPEKFIQEVTKDHHYIVLGAPYLSQLVGVRALSLPQKYISTMVGEYKRRRDFIVSRLNNLGLPTHKPAGAFYTFSDISRFGNDSSRFSRELLNRGKVAVIPGREFGNFGEGFVRCSFATKFEKIEEAMERLEKFLGKRN